MTNKLTVDSGVKNCLDAFPGISGRSSELLVNKRSRYFGESEVLAVSGEVQPHGDVHRDLFVRGHNEHRTMASIANVVNAKRLPGCTHTSSRPARLRNAEES